MQKAVSSLMNVLLDTCVIVYLYLCFWLFHKMIINVFVLIYFIMRKNYDNSIFESEHRKTTSWESKRRDWKVCCTKEFDYKPLGYGGCKWQKEREWPEIRSIVEKFEEGRHPNRYWIIPIKPDFARHNVNTSSLSWNEYNGL